MADGGIGLLCISFGHYINATYIINMPKLTQHFSFFFGCGIEDLNPLPPKVLTQNLIILFSNMANHLVSLAPYATVVIHIDPILTP